MPTSDQPGTSGQVPAADCPLILASASPRRQELMARFWPGRIRVCAPPFDEEAVIRRHTAPGISPAGFPGPADDPQQLACILSAGKITALQAHFPLPETYCAIAADTLVLADGQLLGKPAGPAEAAAHLRLLSGKIHRVVTGICLHIQQQDSARQLQAVEETRVCFTELDEAMISWYIATGEPFDKAGSYGIQGCGAALVRRIDGCYYNVMGLPVHRLMALLREAAADLNSHPALAHLLPWN